VAERGEQLPLDSPGWIPIAEAHRAVLPLMGSRDLAAQDLSEVVADGSVPCMRRRLGHGEGPERELVPLPFWKEYWFMHWLDVGLQVMNRPAGRGPSSIATYRGFAFFVWKPALARIWPAAFAPAIAAPSPPMTEIDVLRRAAADPSPRPKGSRAQDSIRLIVAENWPDGYEGVETGHIIKIVSSVLEKRGIRVPQRDTFLRALKHRKG
jgi:hypothetical protein